MLEKIKQQICNLNSHRKSEVIGEVNSMLRNVSEFLTLQSESSHLSTDHEKKRKILSQRSFFRTKKMKNKKINKLSKPTDEEKQVIESNIIGDSVAIIHEEHPYAAIEPTPSTSKSIIHSKLKPKFIMITENQSKILKKFLNVDIEQIVQNGHVIEAKNIKEINAIDDSIIDCAVDSIKHLFSESAWELLSSVIEKKKLNWLCHFCLTSTTYKSMVQCDMCQVWLHYECAGYCMESNNVDWFC
ncbi:hypothetical protein X975_25988, partial [Stegodyphus mimosarum]